MRQIINHVLALILLVSIPGCSTPDPGGDSSSGVTFSVSIHAESFSNDRPLRLTIWNAEQMEIMQSNANCAVSYNAETETEEVHCPDGVEYEQATPEEFTFPLQEIGDRIEVESGTVRVGERYRLQVSGLSSDDCNTTSASIEEIAREAHVTIEDLVWMTTMMACP